MVAPGEVVVVRRLGRVVEPPWGPGLHWHFPAGIDRLDRIRTDAVRQLTIGQSGPPSADQEPSAGRDADRGPQSPADRGDPPVPRRQCRRSRPPQRAGRTSCSPGPPRPACRVRSPDAGSTRCSARIAVSSPRRCRTTSSAPLDGSAPRHPDPGRQPDRGPPARRGRRRFRGGPVRGGPSRRPRSMERGLTRRSSSPRRPRARGDAGGGPRRGRTDLLAARAETDQFLALLAEVRRSRELEPAPPLYRIGPVDAGAGPTQARPAARRLDRPDGPGLTRPGRVSGGSSSGSRRRARPQQGKDGP